MDTTELNNPIVRQSILKSRLVEEAPLIASALAAEFDVSLDTIRRDLLALESSGAVRRVRGGAIPVNRPVRIAARRNGNSNPIAQSLATAALPLIKDGMVILLDGGTTTAHLAHLLPTLPNSLIVTPAPTIALTTMEKGIETILIGGRLSAFGGIAVGSHAERAIEAIATDLCFMGVCGIDAQFGLSSDDFHETAMKQSMRVSSHKVIALVAETKLGQRARHKTLRCEDIDRMITNANEAQTTNYLDTGMIVDNV